MIGPLAILQGIYAKYFGLSLSIIALVLVLSRLFDAITDPIIGHWSDYHHNRSGSRKPFILYGGLLFIISGYFLYVPPENVSPVYFLGWFLAFYLTYTMVEIPHLAWARELAKNTHDIGLLYGWRALSVFLGSLLFYAMPLLPIFDDNAFTPQTLQWSVVAAAFLMFPALFFMSRVPNTINIEIDNHSHNSCEEKEQLGSILVSLGGNTPLKFFLVAFLCVGIGIGMWFSLVFLFVDRYLGLGDDFAWVYIISFGTGMLTIGIWPKLSTFVGKKLTWALAMVIIIFGLLGMGLLTPNKESQVPLVVSMILIYVGFAAWNILAPSLLSDIVDYGHYRSGRARGGTYFSLYTLVAKANIGIGGALGLGIADSYGFNAMTLSQTSEAVKGLHLAMVWLPVPLVLASIVFIMLIPINARRHAIIRRYLDTRSIRKRSSLYPDNRSLLVVQPK